MNRALIILIVLAALALYLYHDEPPQHSMGVPRDFNTIQEAVDAAIPGSIIEVDAREGPYLESVVISTQDISLRSINGRAEIFSPDEQDPVIFIASHGVHLEGFSINGGYVGILLESALQNKILNNFVSQNLQGIVLNQSQGNQIANNEIVANDSIGILLHESKSNVFDKNIVSENPIGGIFLESNSTDNYFHENTIETSDMGVRIQSSPSNRFDENKIGHNTTFGVSVESANLLEFTGCLFEENGMAMRIVNGTDTKLFRNKFEQNSRGIEIQGSVRRMEIFENSFVNNSEYSIKNTSIENVIALNNYWGDSKGPRVATEDDESVPNSIMGKVDFDPWLVEPID